jgi:catechol 2,3-dioxygenase-like lactoylglutathione lyase family enzyme
LITHLFAGVAVTDFAAACAWYERLFARPPDMLPEEGEAVWRLTSGGSIYVKADTARAGTGRLTIAVSDLGAQLNALGEDGAAVDDSKPGPARVTLSDADGNTITFFEDPAGAPSQTA